MVEDLIMPKTIAIYSSDCFATFNFRGSFIKKVIDQGHRVVCFLPNSDHDTQLLILELGAEIFHVDIRRTSMNIFHIPIEILSFIRAMNDIKPDILFCFFIKPNLIGGLVIKLFKNVRFVCIIEGAGSLFSKRFSSTWFKRCFQKIMLKVYRFSLINCKCVMFLNEEDVNQFLSLNLISTKQVKFIGAIGVDLEKFAFPERNIQDPIFLMCARIIKEKGVVEFIEASKMIVTKYQKAQFFLLGGLDDHPSALTKGELVSLLEGSPVIWYGHTEVTPFLKKSTCFVLPTFYREGSPRSIQEALAASLPVITTNIPGCKELIVHDETGFLIKPQCVDSLVKAMEKIIINPRLGLNMGIRGRKFAEKHLNCNVVDKLMYNALIGDN